MPVSEEELESQARAPPSATLPSSSGHAQQPTSTNARGGRMINAVFHRRHQANAAGPHPPGAPPMQPEDMVLMSMDEQQLYYQQQEQQQQDLYLQMQQQSQHSQQSQSLSDIANGGHAPPTNTTPKKGIAFRPTGRAGAAFINSMKNLNISSAVLGRASQGNQSTPSKGTRATSKEWETRWDEDDDDDDSEEEIQDQKTSKVPAPQHRPGSPQHSAPRNGYNLPLNHNQHAATTMPPLIRPGMDMGLSSPIPQMPSKENGKAHLVTATPEPGVEDGVEWDTGVAALDAPGYEKPNMQMFLPLLRVLGKGSFGKVVLVQKRVGKERGQLFAMKILRKSHLVRRRQIERTRTERKVLSVVNHPFIMKLHYAFQTPDKLYLVLDYCPGGELFFHLSRFRRFPERVARFYAAELLLALGHLHKRGIIYRDLKPENVLLDAEGHVKLGDFGLAKVGIQHACEGATSMCGTPEYMAPEVLAQQGHGFCVDYWGLGMLLYEMMTGLPPWYTTDRTRLFRRLRSAPLDIPSYFSPSSATCVSALLERNPRRRLGVNGIRAAMEHEFFRSISWRALYGRRVEAPIRPCEGWNPQANPSASEQMQGDHPELDAATANFDNTFTRMPVETDDHPEGGNISDPEDLEELHEDTFIGFTYDDFDRDEMLALQQMQLPEPSSELRQRTHHFTPNAGMEMDMPPTQATTGPARHLD